MCEGGILRMLIFRLKMVVCQFAIFGYRLDIEVKKRG